MTTGLVSPPREHANLVLTGFMGTGKTSIGQQVAQWLGRAFVDMDELITNRAQMSIREMFAQKGEPAFRRWEQRLCHELSQRRDLVIATGGGALLPEQNRRRMQASGLIVCFNCSVDELLSRLSQATDRPLLDVSNRRAEVERLLRLREAGYAAMPVQLDTTCLSVDEAAKRVVSVFRAWQRDDGGLPLESDRPAVLPVRTRVDAYQIHLGRQTLPRLGRLMRDLRLGNTGAVVSNPTVWPLHGSAVEDSLRTAGLTHFVVLVTDGEEHKTLATVARLYDDFLSNGLDRGGWVVAFGGGVVGDIAGFAADTYMRGLSFVQVPTTLLAMVDSCVGGKTGVDLPQGKNLVGAFKQPDLVIADTSLLGTVPPAQLRCGMAEVIKAGIIADPPLIKHLERCAELRASAAAEEGDLSDAALDMPWIIQRALLVKIGVIEEDPLEKGRRAILNLGHTVGHALERVSQYRMLHGEAVAIGTVAAARLAVRVGLAQHSLVERVRSLLRAYGLPWSAAGHNPHTIWEAMQSDKKRRHEGLRWVLPRDIGDVIVTSDVPSREVLAVLSVLCSGPSVS